MEQHARSLAHCCLVPSRQRVPSCQCHFLVHVHLQDIKQIAILLMFVNTSSKYHMIGLNGFVSGKRKRQRRGWRTEGGGGGRNLHLSLKWRDELGKSQRILVLWRWVASFVSRKEWYTCHFTSKFLACFMTTKMAPQRLCKDYFFQEEKKITGDERMILS